MQSFSNVIKGNNVINQGNKEVITICFNNRQEEKCSIVNEDILLDSPILEKAYLEADEILQKARSESEKILKDSYEKGYKDGLKKGIDEGHIEINKLKKDGMKKIEDLYGKAVDEYNKYLKSKEKVIRELIIKIVRKVLNKELEFSDSLNGLVIDEISEEQSSKIIIRCSERYCSSLKSKIEEWKRDTGRSTDIFVIEDITLGKNVVVLIKDQGKTILDIDTAISNIEQIILGN